MFTITLNKRGEKKASEGVFKMTPGKAYEAVYGLTGYVMVKDDDGEVQMLGSAYYNF